MKQFATPRNLTLIMSLARTSEDKSETELIAACDKAAMVKAEAETKLATVRIRGKQWEYGIARVAAIAARERSWDAQKALKCYRAGRRPLSY